MFPEGDCSFHGSFCAGNFSFSSKPVAKRHKMTSWKSFLKPKYSSVFGFPLKYFELTGFSLWKNEESFKYYRVFAISMLVCYWTINLSNIAYHLIDFDSHLMTKLLSLSFLHLTGLFKYIIIVSSQTLTPNLKTH